ncbi:phosphatase PAP2 family protein [Peribacillus simplex]|uniref:phosphatase PAP2 family protein n=2 Tax=Peribacillus TaxID=2675229 RepID=UPI001E397594|nr:phosphatase PAP2 family protein [Peribacillus simplex]MDR4927103.1 phosphatase PAP2 family protein [Peribacillus simplex]WHX92388.1 phosphatase PAP2 family protein [Peribacillus simplex]
MKKIILKECALKNHLMETAGFIFPSGHAMVGLIFFSMFSYLIMKEFKGNSLKWAMEIGFVCLVLLIGVSRIAMKVHVPTWQVLH